MSSASPLSRTNATGQAIEPLIVRLHDGSECTAFAGERPMCQFDVIRGGGDVSQVFSSVGHRHLLYLHQMTFAAKGSRNNRLRKEDRISRYLVSAGSTSFPTEDRDPRAEFADDWIAGSSQRVAMSVPTQSGPHYAGRKGRIPCPVILKADNPLPAQKRPGS